MEKLKKFKPLIAVFNGKCETFHQQDDADADDADD